MGKLEAIDKLVDGHKVRRKIWRPKTKHVFLDEDGFFYLAQRINDSDAKLINMNSLRGDDWEIYHYELL